MIDGNTLLSTVNGSRGAPMGRRTIDDNQESTVTLFRMRMVDECYDIGGAYWGMGTPMFAAIGDGFQHFLRAENLEDAKAELLEEYPDLKVETTEVNDDFVTAYIETALYSTNDDNDEPLDANYQDVDIDPKTREKMVDDCRKFLEKFGHLITDENCKKPNPMSHAGRDFWFNRNGHGCGFWDGDWDGSVSEQLSNACRELGEVDLYVGDDGKIYT